MISNFISINYSKVINLNLLKSPSIKLCRWNFAKIKWSILWTLPRRIHSTPTGPTQDTKDELTIWNEKLQIHSSQSCSNPTTQYTSSTTQRYATFLVTRSQPSHFHFSWHKCAIVSRQLWNRNCSFSFSLYKTRAEVKLYTSQFIHWMSFQYTIFPINLVEQMLQL